MQNKKNYTTLRDPRKQTISHAQSNKKHENVRLTLNRNALCAIDKRFTFLFTCRALLTHDDRTRRACFTDHHRAPPHPYTFKHHIHHIPIHICPQYHIIIITKHFKESKSGFFINSNSVRTHLAQFLRFNSNTKRCRLLCVCPMFCAYDLRHRGHNVCTIYYP